MFISVEGFPRKSVNKKRSKTNLLCHHHHINHSSWPISTWEIAQLVPVYLVFENARKNILKSNLVLVVFLVLESKARGGSRIFFRRGGGGALVSCSTSTLIIHFFFCRIPVALENRRSYRGGGCAPLHSPPRSAPESSLLRKSHTHSCFVVESIGLYYLHWFDHSSTRLVAVSWYV